MVRVPIILEDRKLEPSQLTSGRSIFPSSALLQNSVKWLQPLKPSQVYHLVQSLHPPHRLNHLYTQPTLPHQVYNLFKRPNPLT